MPTMTVSTQRLQVPVLHMRAELVPSSWREEDGSVDACLSAGARGRRRDYFSGEEYDEELDMSAGAIRMERLNAGCSVLDSHYGYGVGSVLGRVVPGSARLESGKLYGRLQLSKSPDNAGFVADVRAGIINAISVGYRTHKKTIDDTTTPPLHRAIDWEVFEVSFVPIGFDAAAHTRSAPAIPENECEVTHLARSNGAMDPDQLNPQGQPAAGGTRSVQPPAGGAPAAGGTPVVTPPDTRGAPAVPPVAAAAPAAATLVATRAPEFEAGAQHELDRQTGIRSLGTRLRIEEAVLAPMLSNRNVSLDQARMTFVEHVAVRSDATSQRPMGAPAVGLEERDKVRAAAEYGLMHRADSFRYPMQVRGQGAVQPPEGSRDFAGMTLRRLGEELVRRQDPSYRLGTADDLIRRMFSTSDFPNIAEGAVRRTLRDQYQEQPQSFDPFVRRTTMQDFRTTNRLQLSAAAALLEVPQSGEIEGSEMGESVEGYKLTTFARIVPINRQTIINDDLSAFSRVPQLMGAAARRLEADKVYAVLTANAAMADTVALFHATHANLITPALALAGLTAMRLAMRKQTGQAGELLNLMPKVLIVPAALETTAWQLINGEIFATTNASANPFKGSLELVIDPRLDVASATVWYATCSPSQCDTIELAFLEGANGPVVEREDMFNVLGMALRVYHDIGVKAIDFRGMIKSSATT